MNEDSVIATSELSNAISAICYNLSNMLDKRDENSTISGNVEISGSLLANGSFAHDNGTFSINPQDGTKGFFIGDKNLYTIIDNAIADVQIPTDLSAFTNSPGYLISNDVKISYSDQTIWLSSKSYVTSVDCTDFIKDGMLSTVELCGTMLVMTFNTDAGSNPISVELSNFVDNYDDKIEYLSDSISNISNDLSNYLDKRDERSVVSGGIEIMQHNLSVISGNYI